MRSCVIILANLHEMSVMLIVHSRWAEGVRLSIFSMPCPLTELLHAFSQHVLISLLCFCLIAEGLTVSVCLRKLGRRLLSDVLPSMALFASLSALSLPGMPTCPAVHRSTRGWFLHPLRFCRKVAWQRISLAMLCAGLFRSEVNAASAA